MIWQFLHSGKDIQTYLHSGKRPTKYQWGQKAIHVKKGGVLKRTLKPRTNPVTPMTTGPTPLPHKS